MSRSYVHVHLVSDATGETLIAASRAAAAQFAGVSAIEHVYPLVRTRAGLERIVAGLEEEPGIVLYTLVDGDLAGSLEEACREQGCPCLSVLAPVHDLFRSYLGAEATPKAGAQHVLDAAYFKRIDALNYVVGHDDGQLTDDLESADVVLLGVSRTSKTPTSIYLANRGIKTANVPLVPGVPPPDSVLRLRKPLVVGLVASAERIVQIRQNRLLALNAGDSAYVDRDAVAAELAASRRLFAARGWPMIDVTRRSIEEVAAAILDLHKARRLASLAQ